jgi:hypothetical protein
MLTRLVFILACLLLASGWPELSLADDDDDYNVAQTCFNDAGNSRDVLHCLDTIRDRTDWLASQLKCAIRVADQGMINAFDFPWLYTNSDEPIWITVLNALSDRDLDLATAALIQGDCRRSSYSVMNLLGDYYWLRANLLKVSAIEAEALKMNLPALIDSNEGREIGFAWDNVISDCAGMSPDAPIWHMSLCVDVPGLSHDVGETTFEKMVNSMRHRR